MSFQEGLIGPSLPEPWTFRPVGSGAIEALGSLGQEASNGLRQDPWFKFHLLPGEAGDPPTGELEVLLSSSVIDEGGVGVVEASAVAFEDQPLGAPEEVGLVAPAADLESYVHLRLGQADLEAEVQEPPLKLTAAALVLRVDRIDQQPEPGYATPPASATNLVAQLLVADQPHRFGLTDRLSQLPRLEHGGLVEQWFFLVIEAPECSRGSVRQNRPLPTGKNGSEENALDGQSWVTDREDPLVDPVESTCLHSGGSGSPIHSDAFELSQCHETVLPVCDRSDLEIPTARS